MAVSFNAVVFGAALLHLAAPACAADRIYVSAKTGADMAGCGSPAAPCRTFQFAHNEIAAGGEIHILDPGDYKPVNITKSLSIINDGAGTAGVLEVPAGTNAIEFNGAAADRLYLRGITVDAPAGGLNGVLVNSAGKAVFTEIHARRFIHGVNICPRYGPAEFTLTNSVVSENANGVSLMAEEPPGSVTGVIERVTAVNNTHYGVHVEGDHGAAPLLLTIKDSVFTNNKTAGVIATSSTTPTSVTIRGVVANNNVRSSPANGGYGFLAVGSQVTMRLSHSVASGNNLGVGIQSGARAETYGDNNIRGNLTDISGGALAPVSPQ